MATKATPMPEVPRHPRWERGVPATQRTSGDPFPTEMSGSFP